MLYFFCSAKHGNLQLQSEVLVFPSILLEAVLPLEGCLAELLCVAEWTQLFAASTVRCRLIITLRSVCCLWCFQI